MHAQGAAARLARARTAKKSSSVSIIALRRRMPLIVFILVAIVCLLAIGFACACFNEHPLKALERAVASVPASPAPVLLWPVILVSLLAPALVLTGRREAVAARSPADLQRFLF